MNFLAAIAAKVIQWLLAKGAKLAWAWLRYVWATKKDHKELEKKIENLEKAETPDEIKKATQDIVNHF